MLVVHPQDRTTDVLQLLYEGLEAKVITKECSNRMMWQFLHSTSIRDRIMLLGHGSERGLYYRKNQAVRHSRGRTHSRLPRLWRTLFRHHSGSGSSHEQGCYSKRIGRHHPHTPHPFRGSS